MENASAQAVSSACVDSIKTRLINGTFAFTESGNPDLDQLAKALNADIKAQSESPAHFLIYQNRKNQSVGTLSIERDFSDDDLEKSFFAIVSLSNNPNWPLNLNLGYGTIKSDGTNLFLSQTIHIDTGCKSRVVDTTRTDISKNSNSNFTVTEIAMTSAGFLPPNSFLVTIPPRSSFQSQFVRFQDRTAVKKLVEDLKTKRTFEYFNSKIPAEEIKISDAADLSYINPTTRKSEVLRGHNIALVDGSSTLAHFQTYFSSDSEFSLMRVGQLDSLVVDETTWNQTQLTAFSDIVDREVKIVPDHISNGKVLDVKLTLDHKLEFPNIAAYWDVTSSSEIKSGDDVDYVYSMIGRSNALDITDSSPLNPKPTRAPSNPYLKETAYIQISLPQVQAMIDKLKTNFVGTRLDMVKKILALVNSTLVYDESMVSDNVIEPLSTSEILARKKGVCQHFANLFATLARGLNIPTRIISGFLLSENSAGQHAWNEVEIKDGVWLPIEPQNELLYFYHSDYLPVAVSNVYDDPENQEDATKEAQSLLYSSFTLNEI